MALSFMAIVELGFGLIVLTVVVIAFAVKSLYTVKVAVYEQVGLGIKISTKTARKKVSLDGHSSLTFLFSKERMPLPPGDFFYPVDKKKYFLTVYRDKNGQLHPTKLRFDEDNKVHQIVDDRDVRGWYVNDQAKINEAYNKPTGWQQIASVIMIGGAMAFALAVIIITGKYYLDAMQISSGAMTSAAQTFSEAMQTLPTSVPVPPTP